MPTTISAKPGDLVMKCFAGHEPPVDGWTVARTEHGVTVAYRVIPEGEQLALEASLETWGGQRGDTGAAYIARGADWALARGFKMPD